MAPRGTPDLALRSGYTLRHACVRAARPRRDTNAIRTLMRRTPVGSLRAGLQMVNLAVIVGTAKGSASELI